MKSCQRMFICSWIGAQDFAIDRDARDLLGRALVFRLVAEQLAPDPRHGGALEPYRRILACLR